jgi:GTP cyclohydrolase II
LTFSERVVEISNIANLPSKFGKFQIQAFRELPENKEHLAIFTTNFQELEAPLVRIHSECLTGDALGSLKCDCGEQLEFALYKISGEGGMVIYLRQEGRNIGLLNKVNAYALQDRGLNTVEANHQLGFEADERDYEMADYILKYFGISKIKLLTNNPKKMEKVGVEVTERVPIIIEENPYSSNYFRVKREEMGHLF